MIPVYFISFAGNVKTKTAFPAENTQYRCVNLLAWNDFLLDSGEDRGGGPLGAAFLMAACHEHLGHFFFQIHLPENGFQRGRLKNNIGLVAAALDGQIRRDAAAAGGKRGKAEQNKRCYNKSFHKNLR